MAKLPSKFSVAKPVRVVDSGGILVRQVDLDGLSLDNPTYAYSVAMPVMPVDATGTNEDGTRIFSVWQNITIDPLGIPVIRVDGQLNAVVTSFNAIVTSLTAPTLTLTSATGAAPTWDTTFGSDEYAGFYLRLQVSADGIKNADGSYTTPTQDILHQITPSDVANGSISNSELAADGLTSISGTWHIHARYEREDGVTSNWSNEITGTVTSSVAAYSTGTGVDKSQYLTMTGNLSGTVSASGVNSLCATRVFPAITTNIHAEVTVTALSTASSPAGDIAVGICDSGSVTSFTTTSGTPGASTTNPGASCRIKNNSASATLFYNGTTNNVALTGGVLPAAGDVIVVEYNPTTKTVTFKYVPIGTGIAQTLLVPTVLSSTIPATPYAYSGGYNLNDQFTGNFGASAFKVTPTAGYAGW